MNFKQLKSKIKSVSFIGKTYDFFIGNRKIEKIEAAKRLALSKNGYKTVFAVESALKDSGVKYFLDFGSLLGMIRDGGFMKHDNDIDYGIYITPEFSWDMLENLLAKNQFKKVKQFTVNGETVEQTYMLNDLTVDFFGHFKEDGFDKTHIFFKKKNFKYSDCEDYHISILKMFDFGDVKQMCVDGICFMCPSQPEKYLESIYTENWRYPDPNWVSEKGPSWNEVSGIFGKRQTFNGFR